jgi:hypothetical protein
MDRTRSGGWSQQRLVAAGDRLDKDERGVCLPFRFPCTSRRMTNSSHDVALHTRNHHTKGNVMIPTPIQWLRVGLETTCQNPWQINATILLKLPQRIFDALFYNLQQKHVGKEARYKHVKIFRKCGKDQVFENGSLIHRHKIEIEWMCSLICLGTKNISSNLHLYSSRPGRYFINVKTPKTFLSSSLGEGGLCSSKSKHDRRLAPRQKLFISKKRLQKQRSQPLNAVLGSCLGYGSSYNSKTTHDKRTASRPKLFCFEDETISLEFPLSNTAALW